KRGLLSANLGNTAQRGCCYFSSWWVVAGGCPFLALVFARATRAAISYQLAAVAKVVISPSGSASLIACFAIRAQNAAFSALVPFIRGATCLSIAKNAW